MASAAYNHIATAWSCRRVCTPSSVRSALILFCCLFFYWLSAFSNTNESYPQWNLGNLQIHSQNLLCYFKIVIYNDIWFHIMRRSKFHNVLPLDLLYYLDFYDIWRSPVDSFCTIHLICLAAFINEIYRTTGCVMLWLISINYWLRCLLNSDLKYGNHCSKSVEPAPVDRGLISTLTSLNPY